jgi:hypothetical protein
VTPLINSLWGEVITHTICHPCRRGFLHDWSNLHGYVHVAHPDDLLWFAGAGRGVAVVADSPELTVADSRLLLP